MAGPSQIALGPHVRVDALLDAVADHPRRLEDAFPGRPDGGWEAAAAAYPATVRLEYTAVDLVPGGAKAFEAALSAARSALTSETLWYRMVAGGPTPRYVRLRPHPGLGAILDARTGQALPDGVSSLIAKTTIEVWTLRPTMSLGLAPPIRP
jgi:hypothetical protein